MLSQHNIAFESLCRRSVNVNCLLSVFLQRVHRNILPSWDRKGNRRNTNTPTGSYELATCTWYWYRSREQNWFSRVVPVPKQEKSVLSTISYLSFIGRNSYLLASGQLLTYDVNNSFPFASQNVRQLAFSAKLGRILACESKDESSRASHKQQEIQYQK